MNIYGAGGHAKVVISIARALNIKIDNIFDDDSNKLELFGLKISKEFHSQLYKDEKFIVAVGNNKIRKQLAKMIGVNFETLIHPSSSINDKTKIGQGSVLMHQSIIQIDTIIEEHCIINTKASIDHDCFIESYVHIGPGAILCGNIKVGEGTIIGAGAVIIPNISIGKWCVIGAGAVVINDIPDYSMVVGIPGVVKKKLSIDE